MGGDEVGFATLEGPRDAEETDDVGVVGVEVLARVGAVDADFVRLRGIFADVLDVPKNVATAVLADEVAKVGSQAHIRGGGFADGPFRGGEVFDQNETLAIEEFVAQGPEEGTESGEREVGLGYAGQGVFGIDVRVGGVREFGNFGIREEVCPTFWVLYVF